jgi:hypothetical protein
MNEERDREDLPGVPPLSPGERRSEFDRMRGEVQRPGTRVLAVPAPEPPAPVGIAPPDPRNVVSNFDTRPIGAFDFAQSGHATMGNGEANTFSDVSIDVPDGYTAVLRRVRVEWSPPAAMLIAQPAAGASPTHTFLISLLRNSGVIPFNTVEFLGDLDLFEWKTHQVFGFWETMGVRLSAPAGFLIPFNINNSVFVGVTFFGTLIPTKSRPPETEIASDPVIVRDYDSLKGTMPDTGAAG